MPVPKKKKKANNLLFSGNCLCSIFRSQRATPQIGKTTLCSDYCRISLNLERANYKFSLVKKLPKNRSLYQPADAFHFQLKNDSYVFQLLFLFDHHYFGFPTNDSYGFRCSFRSTAEPIEAFLVIENKNSLGSKTETLGAFCANKPKNIVLPLTNGSSAGVYEPTGLKRRGVVPRKPAPEAGSRSIGGTRADGTGGGRDCLAELLVIVMARRLRADTSVLWRIYLSSTPILSRLVVISRLLV